MKWGAPTVGTPAQVTYALVDKPLKFPGARNCGAMKPLDSVLKANRVASDVFMRELGAALDAWSQAADITFSLASSPEKADVLIGVQQQPRGRAYTNVDYDYEDEGGTRSIRQSLICLNPLMPWKVGFDGNVDVYDLRYTLLHEIGHAIGLDHPSSSDVVMSFKYREHSRALQVGDRFGARILYGQSRLASGSPQGVGTGGSPADMAAPAWGVSSLSLGGDGPARRAAP